MAEILKPNSLNSIWAVAGDRIKPDESKIQQGWLVEIPMRQYENWLTNRQDQAIAHFNQRGVAQWDQNTEYIGGKSYAQGSDGVVYKAVVDSQGVDPATGDTNWTIAFVSADSAASRKFFNGYIPVSSNITATTNSRYYALSPMTITLPTPATDGDGVTVFKAPNINVTVETSNLSQIETSIGYADSIIADIQDEVTFVFSSTNWKVI